MCVVFRFIVTCWAEQNIQKANLVTDLGILLWNKTMIIIIILLKAFLSLPLKLRAMYEPYKFFSYLN